MVAQIKKLLSRSDLEHQISTQPRNRAVTKNDYEILLTKDYNYIEFVSSMGW
jgi:hypothetical protein